jgi:hypothetical protein
LHGSALAREDARARVIERRLRAPTSQSPLGATTGKVARELPLAPALLIRQELAQK